MCANLVPVVYMIQRGNPNVEGNFNTVWKSKPAIGTHSPIFDPIRLPLTQIANSDVNCPIRIAFGTNEGQKIVGLSEEFSVAKLNDNKEYAVKT